MSFFNNEIDSSLPVQSLEIDDSMPSLSVDELGLEERIDDGQIEVAFGKRDTVIKVNHNAKWR